MSLKVYNISGPSWVIQDDFIRRLSNCELDEKTANIYLHTPPTCRLESTPSRLILIDEHLILEPTTPERNERLLLVNLAAIGERDDDDDYNRVDDFILAEDQCQLIEHWFVKRTVGERSINRQHCLSVLIKSLTNEARVAFFFSADGHKHILLASDVRGIRTYHLNTAVFGQSFINRVLKEVHDWTSFRLNELSAFSETRTSRLSNLMAKLRQLL